MDSIPYSYHLKHLTQWEILQYYLQAPRVTGIALVKKLFHKPLYIQMYHIEIITFRDLIFSYTWWNGSGSACRPRFLLCMHKSVYWAFLCVAVICQAIKSPSCGEDIMLNFVLVNEDFKPNTTSPPPKPLLANSDFDKDFSWWYRPLKSPPFQVSLTGYFLKKLAPCTQLTLRGDCYPLTKSKQ